MNAAIPMIALTNALEALKAAHARLLDPTAPDPYITVLHAEINLEHYLGEILKNTQTEVTK